MAKKIPISIDNCPIVEATIELRFQSQLQDNLLLSKALAVLSDEYPEFEPLDAANIPLALVQNNEAFRFAAHFRVSKGRNVYVGMGPRSISVTHSVREDNPYAGWAEFKAVLDNALKLVEPLNIIDEYNRVGIRYVNYLGEIQIEDVTDIKVTLPKEEEETVQSLFLNYEVEKGHVKSNIRIGSKVEIRDRNQIEADRTGLVLDIDVYQTRSVKAGATDKAVEALHKEVKKHFFEILSSTYISQHDPVYAK